MAFEGLIGYLTGTQSYPASTWDADDETDRRDMDITINTPPLRPLKLPTTRWLTLNCAEFCTTCGPALTLIYLICTGI